MKRPVFKFQFHLIQCKKFLILFKNRILRLLQDLHKHILIQSVQSKDDRKSSDKFRNHSKTADILHCYFLKQMRIIIIFILQVCIKTDRCLLVQPFFNDILQIRKSTATDKQNITCINSYKRYHCVFAVCTYRNFHLTSLKKLQHSLLHCLTTDISLVGVLLLGNLVNLINENNTMLGTLHIIICRCQKFGNNALYIIANITGFCKRSGICNCKRHIQKFRQGFNQIGFTASGWSDHQHIRFLNFNLIHCICRHTFIVIVNRYRHYFLGFLLTDHILVKGFFDLMGSRNIFQIQNRFFLFLFLFFFLWLLHRILEAAQIDHTHIRHIQQVRIIELTLIKLLIHRIKALLHTICADMYVIWKFDHRTGLALRSAAEKTEFFGFVSLFLCVFAAVYYFIIIIVLAHNDSFLYPLYILLFVTVQCSCRIAGCWIITLI